MRIISGIAGGRKLKMPKGGLTRPAMNMVKEATFNILGQLVTDAIVLDLFAGSGSLGIEALSRGAKSAVFVDSSKDCIKTIWHNLKLTGFDNQSEVYCMSCIRFVKKKFQEPFDIVFVDPPYQKNLVSPLLPVIEKSDSFNSDTIFIIERQKRDEHGLENNEKFKIVKERAFGDTVLTFFRIT